MFASWGALRGFWIRAFVAASINVLLQARCDGLLSDPSSTSRPRRQHRTIATSKHVSPDAWVDHEPEYFSVAPMMGHTHRHYRYFFGQLSQRAWLYTEMIPAGRLLQSYLHAISSFAGPNDDVNPAKLLHPENILAHAERLRQDYSVGNLLSTDPVLQELLNPGPNPAVLQLGGRDPDQLASAAAIAAAFGYRAVNLNCGCPSTSVSARATGAALMEEPGLVASCLEAMSLSMDRINPSAILSVKHRLGVYDAALYDATFDHAQNDQAAYETCHKFVKTISSASKLSRIQVHARVALLGLDSVSSTESNDDEQPQSTLWTPASAQASDQPSAATIKVNHQRVQYHAKQRARKVTLQNRSVPPLRPHVVERIAENFVHLQVSSNGGINDMDELQRRLDNTYVAGAMVGRAAINHPCSFASVDSVLWNDHGVDLMTRRKVLLNYIEYCIVEESKLQTLLKDTKHGEQEGRWRKEEESMAWHRRRLIAPAFHLCMGEEGNEPYQRRLRKLVGRATRHSAFSMLMAAMSDLPGSTLDKTIKEKCTAWDEIIKYEFTKRSGAMQRTIY